VAYDTSGHRSVERLQSSILIDVRTPDGLQPFESYAVIGAATREEPREFGAQRERARTLVHVHGSSQFSDPTHGCRLMNAALSGCQSRMVQATPARWLFQYPNHKPLMRSLLATVSSP